MAYGWKRTETVQSSQVTGTLTDYPALFSRTHNDFRTVGNGGHVQNANGYDLNLFADSGGSPGSMLDMETEAYNSATGLVRKWARVPSIAVSTAVWWQYGDSGISATQDNPTAVWPTSFKGVYHDPYTGVDSTSNNSDGTPTNGVTQQTGQIGAAGEFDRTADQYVDLGNPSALQITGNLSVSAWVSRYPSFFQRQILAKDNSTGGRAYTFDLAFDGISRFYIDGGGGSNQVVSTTSPSNNTFSLYAGTYATTGELNIYFNGASDATTVTGAAGSIPSATANAMIGRRQYPSNEEPFDGRLDEVRIVAATLSAAWLEADYNNQFAPTSFWGLGSESAVGGGTKAKPMFSRPTRFFSRRF